MSLAVRLFVIDYAFIYSSGKKRQQNFPPRSVFFWVLQKPLREDATGHQPNESIP
jgi:hypothetical protein